jgi:hypothetical protein
MSHCCVLTANSRLSVQDGCRGFRGGPKIVKDRIVDRLSAQHTLLALLYLILPINERPCDVA